MGDMELTLRPQPQVGFSAFLGQINKEIDCGELTAHYQQRKLEEKRAASRTTAKPDVSARSSARNGARQPPQGGSKVKAPEAPAAAGRKRKSDEEATGSSKRPKRDVPAKPSVRTGTRPSSKRPSPPKSRRDAPVASATNAAKPRGLLNYRKLDFANAVLQCLARCDDLVNHYRPMRKGAMSKKDIWNCDGFDPADSAGRLDQQGSEMRKTLNDRFINRTTKL